MLFSRDGIHKMVVRIAKRDCFLYELVPRCFSRLIRQATSVRNFRTFTVINHQARIYRGYNMSAPLLADIEDLT